MLSVEARMIIYFECGTVQDGSTWTLDLAPNKWGRLKSLDKTNISSQNR